MGWIARNAWILLLGITFVNAVNIWAQCKKEIALRPELEDGYRRLLRGFVICQSVPWIVMGAGSVFGGVPGFFHYFNPRNGPFVVAFYVTTALISLLVCYWVIFRGGAEELLRHPGFINLPVDKAWILKAVAILAVVSEVVAFTTMFFLNIQVPRFLQD
jgi:hypothetical protein